MRRLRRPISRNRNLGGGFGRSPRRGRGEITENVFTFLVKHPSIAGWNPSCFSIALVDPDTAEDEVPVFFDQTGYVKLAPRTES